MTEKHAQNMTETISVIGASLIDSKYLSDKLLEMGQEFLKTGDEKLASFMEDITCKPMNLQHRKNELGIRHPFERVTLRLTLGGFLFDMLKSEHASSPFDSPHQKILKDARLQELAVKCACGQLAITPDDLSSLSDISEGSLWEKVIVHGHIEHDSGLRSFPLSETGLTLFPNIMKAVRNLFEDEGDSEDA